MKISVLKFYFATIFQSAQHFYKKKEGSGSALVTNLRILQMRMRIRNFGLNYAENIPSLCRLSRSKSKTELDVEKCKLQRERKKSRKASTTQSKYWLPVCVFCGSLCRIWRGRRGDRWGVWWPAAGSAPPSSRIYPTPSYLRTTTLFLSQGWDLA